MSFSLSKVKSIFNDKKNKLMGSGSLEPEIGFKVVHNQASNSIIVTLMGARHLPSLFGLSRAKGYVVKLKLFPGDVKFESQFQDTSWPVWNEEFKFPLNAKKSKKVNDVTDSQLTGHFLSLTVYAILEVAVQGNDKKKLTSRALSEQGTTSTANSPGPTSTLSRFEKIMSTSFKGTKTEPGSKGTPEKRRTIGAATWNFDQKLFKNKLRHDQTSTPDIWRPIEQLNSGMSASKGVPENKKGQVEVTFLYSTSEDGCQDTIDVNVTKMRCNIQTMQEHELRKEPLYIKASITDNDKSESHWKSDRFFPTISARWDKNSCARLRFNSRKLQNISVYVSLGCKNSMAIKEILGKVIIGPHTSYSEFWQELIDSPGVPKTNWFPFE